MEQIQNFFSYLLNSEELIRTGGLITITLIVFIENGFVFGFFLPGDYLLFLSGVFCGTKILNVPIALLIACILVASVLGALIGYISGRYFGDHIETKRESFFFKKKHVETTQKYFDKYGSRTLVIARFLPVVRTFAPILAGMVKMKFREFLVFNVLGGAIWTFTLVGGGFYLGEHFPKIGNYVHYIVFFFLALTTYTVVMGYLNARKGIE